MKRTGFACLLLVLAIAPRALAWDVTPKKLLIYYGWPSSINATFSVPLAAAEFGQYDYVVLAAGLEQASHPDHQNTVDIMAAAATAGVTFFGYVDLGVTTNNYSPAEIEARVDLWLAAGADGIFFDDFGYDFLTGRDRQNAAVDYAHGQGMPVVANAWVPADAFDAAVDASLNPGGAATTLGSGDFYLYESHQIILGGYESEGNWQSKATALAGYQSALGFSILSITTNDSDNGYDENAFWYAWYSALIYGHAATGWGEYNFSAASAQAPLRARPELNAGTVFTSEVSGVTHVYSRKTDLATVFVNAVTHEYGSLPVPVKQVTWGQLKALLEE
jgi:hypothetical protein